MTSVFGKWKLLFGMFVVLVLLDQASKFWAVDRLTNAFQVRGDVTLAEKLQGFYGHRHLEIHAVNPKTIWEPMWAMRYVENPGAAWGLFHDMSEGSRNTFFTLVSLSALAFILVYYRRLRVEQRYAQVALGLLLSGAMGNFIDRLARQYVIDFIDWYAGSWHWPTFNLADSMIVVGVLMLLVHPGPGKPAEGQAREVARGG